MKMDNSKENKRKAEDEDNTATTSPGSSSKVEIVTKRFREVAPSKIQFQLAKFYPSGKYLSEWRQYDRKTVFIVDEKYGWCQIVFPPLPQGPGQATPSLKRKHINPISVHADVMKKFDFITPKSQCVLLEDQEITAAEIAWRDEIIKFLSELDTVSNLEISEKPSLPAIVPPSFEPFNLIQDTSTIDAPVTEKTPEGDALSRILDAVMEWDEIEALSEELLKNLVYSIFTTNAPPYARRELLKDILGDILQDDMIIEASSDGGSQRYCVQNFGLLKEGLKTYINEIHSSSL
jgi:hypothetical protein